MKINQQAGPVVWIFVPIVTCLILYLFQGILWLVVPAILAITLYYLTLPLVMRLMHRGFNREVAVAVVMAGLVIFTGLLVLIFAPIVIEDFGSWTKLIGIYVQAGFKMLIRIANDIERYLPIGHRFSLSIKQLKWDDFVSSIAETYSGILLSQLFHWLPGFLLIPYLTYFLLRDGNRCKKFIVQAIPNAFFERALLLFYQVDDQIRRYLQGMMILTVLDASCQAIGLWCLGISNAVILGIITAMLAWIPYLGSVLGCILVILVAAAEYPDKNWITYGAIVLFILVRFLDDFFFLPLTIGRNLKVHPVMAVLMIFMGAAVAGISGLFLVMPVLGVVSVVGQVIGKLMTDERVRARHAYAVALLRKRARQDLEL